MHFNGRSIGYEKGDHMMDRLLRRLGIRRTRVGDRDVWINRIRRSRFGSSRATLSGCDTAAIITDRSPLTPWLPEVQVGDRMVCGLSDGWSVPDGWTEEINEDGTRYAWKDVTEPFRRFDDVMDEQNLRREW